MKNVSKKKEDEVLKVTLDVVLKPENLLKLFVNFINRKLKAQGVKIILTSTKQGKPAITFVFGVDENER